MEPVTTRARAELDEGRAALMRQAADLIGSERLAKALGVSARSLYWWMSGQRGIKDGVIADTRQLLIAQRQAIADLLQDFREEEADTAERIAAAQPSPAQRRQAKAAERQLLDEARSRQS